MPSEVAAASWDEFAIASFTHTQNNDEFFTMRTRQEFGPDAINWRCEWSTGYSSRSFVRAASAEIIEHRRWYRSP